MDVWLLELYWVTIAHVYLYLIAQFLYVFGEKVWIKFKVLFLVAFIDTFKETLVPGEIHQDTDCVKLLKSCYDLYKQRKSGDIFNPENCPICLNTNGFHSVVTSCLHQYCIECFEKVLKRHLVEHDHELVSCGLCRRKVINLIKSTCQSDKLNEDGCCEKTIILEDFYNNQLVADEQVLVLILYKRLSEFLSVFQYSEILLGFLFNHLIIPCFPFIFDEKAYQIFNLSKSEYSSRVNVPNGGLDSVVNFDDNYLLCSCCVEVWRSEIEVQ